MTQMPRLVAVAIDRDKGSQIALKWTVDNLLGKGHTVVLVHVRVKQTSLSTLPSTSIPSNSLSLSLYTCVYVCMSVCINKLLI